MAAMGTKLGKERPAFTILADTAISTKKTAIIILILLRFIFNLVLAKVMSNCVKRKRNSKAKSFLMYYDTGVAIT